MQDASLPCVSALSIDEAEIQQQRYVGSVERQDRFAEAVTTVTGADVAYENGGDRVVGAVVTHQAGTLVVLERALHEDKVSFPYVPGLFSFREIPPLLRAIAKLAHRPHLIVCDGHGIAHPRRFGLACHLGVLLDIPTIGCAKRPLTGCYKPPGNRRGDCSALEEAGETIGAVLRTQDGVKPVFVSIGHRVSLATACEWVLRLTPAYRLPEPIRQADLSANAVRSTWPKP